MNRTNTTFSLIFYFLLFPPVFPSRSPSCLNIYNCTWTISTEEESMSNNTKLIAKPSSSWTVNKTESVYSSPDDPSIFKPIIYNSEGVAGTNVTVACGFFSNTTSDAEKFFLVIVAVKTTKEREVIWTANRNNPVTSNATLEFNSHGDLILKDIGSVLVWSTNTSGKTVVGMMLRQGNLILHDAKHTSIWSSWDYPSDTLLPGQTLGPGQKLYANVSPSNLTAGIHYISFGNDNLQAFVKSIDNPQIYMTDIINEGGFYADLVLMIQGSHVLYNCAADKEFCFLRLDADGHIRHHIWLRDEVFDLSLKDNCEYPEVCSKYGICYNGDEQTCSCPDPPHKYEVYFEPLQYKQPKFGCFEKTQLACNSSQIEFLELQNVTYFNFVEDMVNVDALKCKHTCLKNCSCKAVVFHYNENIRSGNCSFQSQVHSLNGDYNSYSSSDSYSGVKWVTFLKVQSASPNISHIPINRPQKSSKKANMKIILLGSIAGAIFFVSIIIGIAFKKQANKEGEAEEYDSHLEGDDHLDEASDMPRRFSHEDLKSATSNFSKKIGGGGFGSVYEGLIGTATKIAVKRLDSLGQGRKEFFAEVKTIGNIHHVNLVKLIGFCSESSHKLLVYEYMCNGSLDRWIFNVNHGSLGWLTRRNIILDIAKGLCYLHEQCRKTIVHLDIKPQNVLLDAEFNVKLSDFGLARLIERDQSHVLTTFRGTRGYLAPEWFLNKRISEKVDVYSFGVVVLEIVCGRRNLDHSQPEEYDCLLDVVRRKAEEDQLYDVVDKRNEEMQGHKEEAVEMIKIAISCLQSDSIRRPAMSKVVKILEGGMDVENISDYSFLTLNQSAGHREVSSSGSAPLLPSILSGPR